MGQDQDTIINAGRRLAVSFPLLSDRLMITAKAYHTGARGLLKKAAWRRCRQVG
jgi:hypothetical protein